MKRMTRLAKCLAWIYVTQALAGVSIGIGAVVYYGPDKAKAGVEQIIERIKDAVACQAPKR
jgi:hypothetical protein